MSDITNQDQKSGETEYPKIGENTIAWFWSGEI